jgi:cysteinyl-tRNA synthetase
VEVLAHLGVVPCIADLMCAVGWQIFFEDLHALNIVPASRYPRATEHVNDIVDMVEQLVQR